MTRRKANRLVVEHIAWARSIALGVLRGLPTWFTVEDLSGPASIALVMAARQYDPSRNDNFRGYAYQRIRGACLDAIRRREYTERSHAPTEGLELVSMAPTPEDTAGQQQQRRALWTRVQRLPSRQALVILAVYGGGWQLEELAELVDVGPSRLSQIHHQALDSLRELEPAA